MPRTFFLPAARRSSKGSRFAQFVIPFGLVIFFHGLLHAQLPSAQLTSIFPPGGKVGAAIDVTIAGVDLDDADRLLVSHPGIVALPKIAELNEFVKTPKPVAGAFQIKIAADVPPGTYEVRIVSRYGVSNPRAFVVGSADELLEVAGNNQPDKAQEIPIGAILNGRADASSRDYYKFALPAGQRVLMECVAKQIDSRMDATLVLFGPDGKEIVRNRDTQFNDPLLDFTAPAAGQYVLAVYDFVFAGGADYCYRLSVHSRPHIDFVFPPSGVPGSNSSYTIYGRNLPGGQPAEGLAINGVPLQKLAVTIPLGPESAAVPQLPVTSLVLPRTSSLEGVEFRLPGADPLTIYVAKGPVIAEIEPNNLSGAAQKVVLPCEFVGQFYPARDVDWLQFDAKKGETYQIEVLSHRLGLECDPAFSLKKVAKNEKGEEVVTDVAQADDPPDRPTRIGGDFDTSTDDPSYRFAVPEDATYRLMVRDQFGDSRNDPRLVYRLAIRQLQPDFRLVALPQSLVSPANPAVSPLGTPVLRRGGTMVIQTTVDRLDDFKGEVVVTVDGLPPGVSCPGAVISGDVQSAPLVFTAADNAAAWAGPVRIVGKAQVEGKELMRVARNGTTVWGTANRATQAGEFRLARDLVLAVVDKEVEPALAQAGEDKVWETSLGGTLEIPLNLTRRGEYKEAVKLIATGLPAEIKPAEVNLDANTPAGKITVAINNQATKIGVYTFYLRSDTKMKYVRNPDAIKWSEEEQQFVAQLVTQIDQQAKAGVAAKDAATKAAQDAINAAKQTEQNKTTAANAAKQAADNAKQAADKSVVAKDAAAKDANNQALTDAASAAQKVADETTTQAKTAADQAAVAEKAFTEAQVKAKEAEDARVKAEQTMKAAQDKLTLANQKKQEADKRVTDVKQANQPKDINFALVSTPIKLRVVASPISLALPTPAVKVKQAEKVEIPLKIDRLFGFVDAIEVTLEPPAGVAGLGVPKVAVPNGQGESKLELTADKNATPGEHRVTIRAKAKFNNVNVETTQQMVVTVEKPS